MKTLPENIIVLYNLPQGNDWDDTDTQKSALAVADGLTQLGYEVEVRGISTAEISTVSKLRADLVFNLVEWAGRDYPLGVAVIKELEAAGLPYTGSNPWSYAMSCNKVLMKKTLVKYKIPTPRYQIFETGSEKLQSLPYPLIVKPVSEHAAIGVSQKSVVTNADDLASRVSDLISKYEQPALVEEFVDGDEAQLTVLEKRGKPWVLPPAVFRFQKKAGYWPINTYEAKWGDGWESAMSAWVDEPLPPRTEAELTRLAKLCYEKLGGRSYPRVDMRITPQGQVYVLEVNNNPGIDFDPESGITVAAKAAGLDWPGLLTNIVQEAYLMHHQTYDSAGL